MTDRWRRGTIRGPAPLPASTPLVVKLGGSLLKRPGWAEDTAALLAGCQRPLLVVGGGGLVDGLRAIDLASPQPVDLMHTLAIEAMRLTARLVSEAVKLPIVAEAAEGGGVLDAATWLEAAGSPALPAGWDVTSDSIAAAAARESGRGLLLVKSVPPPPAGEDLGQLAVAGWVDRYFPTAAASLETIAWAALKEPMPP